MGKAQRESARRHKSDWGKIHGGETLVAKSRGLNSSALAYKTQVYGFGDHHHQGSPSLVIQSNFSIPGSRVKKFVIPWCRIKLTDWLLFSITIYDGWSKSFEPKHIRLQFFQNQWNVHSLQTPMSLLQIWRHCNLWHHRALKRNNSKRQWKHLESFIVMDSGHHNHQFYISKQLIVIGSLIITFCRMVLVYEDTVKQPAGW